MNRLLLFALSMGFSCSFCAAQGTELCIQVIASSGKTATRNGLSFAYTVGEPVILSLTGAQNKLTQGFHQPDVCPVVSTHNLDLAAWRLEVFPNPTADWLTVRFASGQGRELRAKVFDLLGRVVLSDQALLQPEGTVLDCTAWQAGIYLLELQDPASYQTATFRVIRL